MAAEEEARSEVVKGKRKFSSSISFFIISVSSLFSLISFSDARGPSVATSRKKALPFFLAKLGKMWKPKN